MNTSNKNKKKKTQIGQQRMEGTLNLPGGDHKAGL